MRYASLRIRRRVVVQNLPPISTLLEQERERSARGHRVTPPQREARGAEREIEGEGAHAHLVERERVAELARRDSLTFDEVRVRPLTLDLALCTARFALRRRNSVTASGPFTLLLQKRGNRWQILHDHTSSDPK